MDLYEGKLIEHDPAFNPGSGVGQVIVVPAVVNDPSPKRIMTSEDRKARATELRLKFFGGTTEDGRIVEGIFSPEEAIVVYSRRVEIGCHKKPELVHA